MGYRSTWIGVKGAIDEGLLRALSLTLSGENDSPERELGFWLIDLQGPDGESWSLILADGRQYWESLTEDHARAASVGRQSLYFSTNDGSMETSLRGFVEGEERWSIAQDPDAPQAVALRGELPPQALEVHAGLAKGQLVDHEYSITRDVGRELLGFAHDSQPEGERPPTKRLRWLPRGTPADGSRLTWWEGIELAQAAPENPERAARLQQFRHAIQRAAADRGRDESTLLELARAALRSLVEALAWEEGASGRERGDLPIVLCNNAEGRCPELRRVELGRSLLYSATATQALSRLVFVAPGRNHAVAEWSLEALCGVEPEAPGGVRALFARGRARVRRDAGILRSALRWACVECAYPGSEIVIEGDEISRIFTLVAAVGDPSREMSLAQAEAEGIADPEIGDILTYPTPVELDPWTVLDWVRLAPR